MRKSQIFFKLKKTLKIEDIKKKPGGPSATSNKLEQIYDS